MINISKLLIKLKHLPWKKKPDYSQEENIYYLTHDLEYEGDWYSAYIIITPHGACYYKDGTDDNEISIKINEIEKYHKIETKFKNFD